MAVRFTAYGGAGEIGGNKLLLEDDDWQIFFDFGMSFGTAGKYFEEFLQPRPSHGLSDFLQTGLLPPLEGLYRSDLSTLPEHGLGRTASHLHAHLRVQGDRHQYMRIEN